VGSGIVWSEEVSFGFSGVVDVLGGDGTWNWWKSKWEGEVWSEKEKRKREPVEPAVLAPVLELPFRRSSFLAEPPQKRTKKTRLSSLAAALTGIRI
jgi:hypothetical protein